jgi:AraC-like DNA-binding protein
MFSASNADLIAHPSIELVRAVIATHHRAGSLAATPLANTLALRVLEYARAQHGDPDLSADQIAAAHFISRRQLYKVLAEQGVSLNDWIRSHRLEACRHDLTKHTHSVAAIAARHGFTNMSSFSRAFRGAFGQSPSEWRDRHTVRALRLRTGGTAMALTAAGSSGQTTGEQLRPDTGTDPPVRTPAVPAAARPVHPFNAAICGSPREDTTASESPTLTDH